MKYDLEAYLKVLALESVRNKTLIIGEDLGTVPDQMREALNRYGIFSYRLFYFERNEEGSLTLPADYPEWAVASISTHDLPPLRGFWCLKDIRTRKDLDLFPDKEHFHQAMIHRILDKRKIVESLHRYGFLSEEEALHLQAQDEPAMTEELHRAVLAYMVSTRAKLAVVSLEDLFGWEDQFNLPGTVTAYPNWSRKMPFSVEDLWGDPEVRKRAEAFRKLIEYSGRLRNPL